MASGAPLTAVLSLTGVVFSGLVLLTLWIWRHTTSLGGEDEERVIELKNHQRSVFSAELADLFETIENCVEEDDSHPEEMSRSERVVNVIEREIEEDDLESVVEELNEISTPEDVFDDHREEYEIAYQKFGWTAVMVLGVGITIGGAAAIGEPPFSSGLLIVEALFLFMAFNFGFDGVKAFGRAKELENKFEKRWREYKEVS